VRAIEATNIAFVTVEHFPEDDSIAASFDWPYPDSGQTYTIDLYPHISIELSKHFPIRIARLSLVSPGDRDSLETITEIAGEPLAEAFDQAASLGFCALKVTINNRQRLALANIQILSPSTPAFLKRACKAILDTPTEAAIQH
jgi:hypothetical protein